MSYCTVPIKPRLKLWEHEIKNIIIYPHLKRILSIASTLDYENDWLSLEKKGIDKIEAGNEFFDKFVLTKSLCFLEIATTIISDFPWSDFLMNIIPLEKHINFTKIIFSSKHPQIDYILINILPTKKFIQKLIEKNAAFTEIGCKGDYDEWLQYFLQTLDEFPETKFILNYLDIDSTNYINYSQYKVDDEGMASDRINFEDKLIVDPKHPGKFRSQNIFNYNIKDTINLLSKFQVELRNYQKECITPALLGESCMLIIPTKTGRKICINEIIRNHISLSITNNKPYRVCLLVSSLQSLSEASAALQNFFQGSISIFSGCLGDFSKHTVDKLLANDVIVVTPIFFYRCLNSLLMEQKIFYDDFTLFIIEDIQCHKNRITSKYLFEDLFMKKLNDNQIVGIYVNISKNYSYHIDDVIDSFIEICTETRLSKISIPKTYQEEMLSYFQNCYDALYPFDIPDSYHKGLIEMKVSRLLMKLQFLKDNGYTFNENGDSLLPSISTYEFMLDLIKIDFELQLSNQNFKIQEMIVVINCLKEYFHAILISSILPLSYTTEFLKERYNILKKHIGHLNCFDINFSDFNIIINEINECYSRQDIQPPLLLLEKVINILKEEILTLNLHHIIVFVQTNYIVKNITKYFNDIFSNHDIQVLGLTNVEASNEILRNTVFNKFQQKGMFIMVTTHVVDWKYNLPKRDLDININDCLYDMDSCLRAPKIIRKMNKRYLFYYPSYISTSCEINIQRQKTLQQFCKEISKICKNDGKIKIENSIKELKLQKSCIENYYKERENSLKGYSYKILCKKCGKYLVSSKSIRKYMDYYIVIDGQIICPTCCYGKSEIYLKTNGIGDLISHGSTYFCNLNPSNIIFENESGERFNKNNWYDIEKRLLYVEEIKEIEWLGYNNEFIKTNPDLVDDLNMLIISDKNCKKVKSKIVHLSECLEIFI
ncbi:P-loop containing nucleoside triphosphate hydrolase domain-containing protein [Strongyloides ratti]|uniref:P-loop containing Nucleoside triphosphate hydrolase domain-containing protein n=1 Tax=Strongyloides ratti TaxID=34506 RepID=A0A090LGT5_STRRB|nr:P-loop containing nucleoside triphosphate hydrolase domain-containing protein [Strongyloides ratti]CEF67338.1 P-loop containing nucleoside triphosphate hydrolase domain-containing protein [Strongyloides ratti]